MAPSKVCGMAFGMTELTTPYRALSPKSRHSLLLSDAPAFPWTFPYKAGPQPVPFLPTYARCPNGPAPTVPLKEQSMEKGNFQATWTSHIAAAISESGPTKELKLPTKV